MLESYESYLLQRWVEGCHTATVLWREIQGQGYGYSVSNVQRFVAELRRDGAPLTDKARSILTKSSGPSRQKVFALVVRCLDQRSDEERADLTHLRTMEPHTSSESG